MKKQLDWNVAVRGSLTKAVSRPMSVEIDFNILKNMKGQLAQFERMFDEKNLVTALEKLLKEDLVPLLSTEYQSRANDLLSYLPTYWSERQHSVQPLTYRPREQEAEESNEHRRSRQELKAQKAVKSIGDDRQDDYRSGLKKLFSSISKISKSGTSVGLGPYGEVVTGHKVWEHSILKPTQTTSMSSFFYTVEFGTGVAGNVGGSRWVRKDGPTKGVAGHPAGTWEYSTWNPQLVQYGQKGFHFLYDEHTRVPLDIYYQKIAKEMPVQFETYFKQFGLNIRLKR